MDFIVYIDLEIDGNRKKIKNDCTYTFLRVRLGITIWRTVQATFYNQTLKY